MTNTNKTQFHPFGSSQSRLVKNPGTLKKTHLTMAYGFQISGTEKGVSTLASSGVRE